MIGLSRLIAVASFASCFEKTAKCRFVFFLYSFFQRIGQVNAEPLAFLEFVTSIF